MEERVIKQGWVSLAFFPQPPSALSNLSSMRLCSCAPGTTPRRATWWGCRLGAMAAGAGSNLALQLPVCLSPLFLLPPPPPGPSFESVWKFCHGGWVRVPFGGSLRSAECTFGPAEPPAALVELAQDLLQLISGLRKPCVVCHFFHPLFFSAFRPFPCQSCSTSSSGAGRKLLWKRADITGVFSLLLLGLGWPSSCVPVR